MEWKIYDKTSYSRDPSAQALRKMIEEEWGDRPDCFCIYQNPLIFNEFNFKPTFVLVDRTYGVVVFRSLNHDADRLTYIGSDAWRIAGSREVSQLAAIEDYCYKLDSDINRPAYKLRGRVALNFFIYLPFLRKDQVEIEPGADEHVIFSDIGRGSFGGITARARLNDEEWNKLLSIIQKADALNKPAVVRFDEPISNLREAVQFNENLICVLDDEQLEASHQITETPERIRGLAGTGKTIVLAMKAARMHYLYPDYRILFTFNTQSLYSQTKNQISRFYRNIAGVDPNWDNLHILHAWGGKSKPGVYYNTCKKYGLSPRPFRDVRHLKSPFGYACGELLNKALGEDYDCILIDEAQDLPVEFFKLTARLAKKPKRIVWAYDELQTTSDVRIPDPDELFGVDEQGDPIVSLPADHACLL